MILRVYSMTSSARATLGSRVVRDEEGDHRSVFSPSFARPVLHPWHPGRFRFCIRGEKHDLDDQIDVAADETEPPLICCKTVKQAVAARAPQIVLTASAIWSARKMRGIPRFRHVIITQSVAVDMADHRRALRAARPIVAGLVFFGRKGAAIRLRAGQHIMIIRRKASTRNHRAALGHRALHVQSIFGAVEIFDGLGDDLAFEILPGGRARCGHGR